MNLIITHGGKAHLDDLVATATVLAAVAGEYRKSPEGASCFLTEIVDTVIDNFEIERRDPTAEEIEDPNIWVLDVGGRYDSSKRNYDHHQVERGAPPVAAMSLVAQSLAAPNGEDSFGEIYNKIFPWFKTRVVLDHCGPFAAAKAEGTEWGTVAKFFGPCEELYLELFEQDPKAALRPLVKYILAKVIAYGQVKSDLVHREVSGIEVLDFITRCSASDAKAVSDCFVSEAGKGVAVFFDDRGEGLTLLRINDDPRVDFTRVSEDPEVIFAHKGGFIAKTKDCDLEKALGLVEKAVVA